MLFIHFFFQLDPECFGGGHNNNPFSDNLPWFYSYVYIQLFFYVFICGQMSNAMCSLCLGMPTLCNRSISMDEGCFAFALEPASASQCQQSICSYQCYSISCPLDFPLECLSTQCHHLCFVLIKLPSFSFTLQVEIQYLLCTNLVIHPLLSTAIFLVHLFSAFQFLLFYIVLLLSCCCHASSHSEMRVCV